MHDLYRAQIRAAMRAVEGRSPVPPTVMFDVAYANPPASVLRDREEMECEVVDQ